VGRTLVREGSDVDAERRYRFDVDVDRHGLIRVCGELDCATAPTLAAVLEPLSSSGGDIDVDLADVGFMGAAGINVLCAAAHALGTRGRIVVRNPSPRATRVIEIAAVGALLHVATDPQPDSPVPTGPSAAAGRTTPATSDNGADRPASPDTPARVDHR
jgi:anti-anti-sigma factor